MRTFVAPARDVTVSGSSTERLLAGANEHFEDARYYLGRATEHATEGIGAELVPVEGRTREPTGREEPEPGRLDRVQQELADLAKRAEGEARGAVGGARDRIRRSRGRDAAE